MWEKRRFLVAGVRFLSFTLGEKVQCFLGTPYLGARGSWASHAPPGNTSHSHPPHLVANVATAVAPSPAALREDITETEAGPGIPRVTDDECAKSLGGVVRRQRVSKDCRTLRRGRAFFSHLLPTVRSLPHPCCFAERQ